MEEFDLNKAWEEGDDSAKEYYKTIEEEVLSMARKNSNDILNRIKRNIKGEWIANAVIYPMIGFILWDDPLFWAYVVFAILILGIAWLPYRKLLKRIDETSSKNIVDALKSYVEILADFTQRMKTLFWMLMIPSLFFGFYLGISQSGGIPSEKITFKLVSITILALGAVFGLTYWFSFKKYFPWLYGKPKNELKKLLEDLKSS